MTQTLKAKFQGGTFCPTESVSTDFAEGQEVLLTIETEEKPTENKPRIAGLHAGLVGWDPTFDDELPDSFWLGEE